MSKTASIHLTALGASAARPKGWPKLIHLAALGASSARPKGWQR